MFFKANTSFTETTATSTKADHNPQVRPRKAVGQGTSFGFGYDSLPRRLWKTNLSRRDGMSRNKVFCDSADVCPTGLDQPDDVDVKTGLWQQGSFNFRISLMRAMWIRR